MPSPSYMVAPSYFSSPPLNMKTTSGSDALGYVSSPANSSCSTLVWTDSELDAERQPLLPKKFGCTPLPKEQLAIICLARLAEPIAYTQIFPYINQMVEELHLTDNPANIGFYSGLVDGLFSLAQLCMMFYWASLSDRIGRKPVVISGLIGICIGSVCFGLSKNLWHVLLFRAMAGLLSGNSAILKSMIGEITDETNQARAYPLESVTWAAGCVLGPLIGGHLSHPVERYPSLFGNVEFLKNYPYFLPCAVSSCITFGSTLIAILFLEETIPKKVSPLECKFSEQDDLVKQYMAIPKTVTDEEPAYPAKQLLADPQIRGLMVVGFLLSFLHVSWDTVFVLFAYTRAQLGGLERTPSEIAFALSTVGILGVFLSIVAFPALQHRFDTLPVFQACMALWPVVFVLFSATSLLTRWTVGNEIGASEPALALISVLVSMILALGRIALMSYPAQMVLLKKAAPNQRSLGATFGLAQVTNCFACALGPVFVNSLFAFSIDLQVLNGQFVWLVMFMIGVWGFTVTRRLR